MTPKISLIVVVSENGVIARNGKIPWHIPPDQKRYREKIHGRVIIAGRRTLDASYTDTINIVVTTQENYAPPVPAVIVHSVDEAVTKAQELLEKAAPDKRDEILVIGGGQIFKETIGIADKIYLTLVHTKTPGDTYFPDYSQFKKKVYDTLEESDGYSYEYLDLER